jgi:hypothetical protein
MLTGDATYAAAGPATAMQPSLVRLVAERAWLGRAANPARAQG